MTVAVEILFSRVPSDETMNGYSTPAKFTGVAQVFEMLFDLVLFGSIFS